MSEIDNLKQQIDELRSEIKVINDELENIKTQIAFINGQVQILVSQNNTIQMILKYVVTPLLIILGGLIGIKLTFP
jgi:predicted  nucleic acid-binding Zn-ribbon protein